MRLSAVQKAVLFVLYSISLKLGTEPVPCKRLLKMVNGVRRYSVDAKNFRISCHTMTKNGLLSQVRDDSQNLLFKLTEDGLSVGEKVFHERIAQEEKEQMEKMKAKIKAAAENTSVCVYFDSDNARPLLASRSRNNKPASAYMGFWINPEDQVWEPMADIDLFCGHGEPSDTDFDGDAIFSIDPRAKASELKALENDKEFTEMLIEIREMGFLPKERKEQIEAYLSKHLARRARRAKS